MKNKFIKIFIIVLFVFVCLVSLTACIPSKRAKAAAVSSDTLFDLNTGLSQVNFRINRSDFYLPVSYDYDISSGYPVPSFQVSSCTLSKVNFNVSATYINLLSYSLVEEDNAGISVIIAFSDLAGIEEVKITDGVNVPFYFDMTQISYGYLELNNINLVQRFGYDTTVYLQVKVSTSFVSTMVAYYSNFTASIGDFDNPNYEKFRFDMIKYCFLDLNDTRSLVEGAKYESYNSGYDSGYFQGYNSGYNTGITNASDYSFFSLISAVIEVPLNAFTSLFNFEVFGYNLTSFITFLFSMCVVFTVLKLII